MEINKAVVDRFLRTAITISVICLVFIIAIVLFGIVHWSVLLAGAIACSGVIISFGVNLNKLHNSHGLPEEVADPNQAPKPILLGDHHE